MRFNILRLIAVLLVGTVVSCSTEEVTQEEAREMLFAEVIGDSVVNFQCIYELGTVLEKGTSIESWNSSYEKNEDAWFFFIDDACEVANWGHDCRYVYIYLSSASSDQIEIINESSPPSNFEELTEIFVDVG